MGAKKLCVRFARTNSGLYHSSKREIVRSLSKIKDVFYIVYRRFWRGLWVPRRRTACLSGGRVFDDFAGCRWLCRSKLVKQVVKPGEKKAGCKSAAAAEVVRPLVGSTVV